MPEQGLREHFKSIAERLTHFRVERMIIIDLSYGTYDHAYLQGTLNAIKDDILSNDMDENFSLDYMHALRKHALIVRNAEGRLSLTPIGKAIKIYTQNMNDFIGEAKAMGFNSGHLYRCLGSVKEINGKTLEHLENIGFVENKALTEKGQSVFAHLETLEIAKWKRAGKPECAPVAF